MQEITGDLFESEKADAIVILTNGFVNKAGAVTMGRGCAAEAKYRWPGIQISIGTLIQEGGNDCYLLTDLVEGQILLGVPETWGVCHKLPYHLVTFPTKPEECRFAELLPKHAHQHVAEVTETERYPGWMAHSDLKLIERSAQQLVSLTDQHQWQSVVLPRPGCGLGLLSWQDEVRPLLSTILDERFYAINFAR